MSRCRETTWRPTLTRQRQKERDYIAFRINKTAVVRQENERVGGEKGVVEKKLPTNYLTSRQGKPDNPTSSCRENENGLVCCRNESSFKNYEPMIV